MDTPGKIKGPIRVLIVDDHQILREGLGIILSQEDDFKVVGEVGTAKEAMMLATQFQPDIVLLDIFLGTANGLDIARWLQSACPATRIVILTGFDDEDLLITAMRIGVDGYLQKTTSVEDLLSALRAVHQGERVISEPRAVTQLLNEFNHLSKEYVRLRLGLSSREIEVVRLAAEGHSNKEIGTRLFWSEVTVKRKMHEIFQKLHVVDRAQAVAKVIRQGLI